MAPARKVLLAPWAAAVLLWGPAAAQLDGANVGANAMQAAEAMLNIQAASCSCDCCESALRLPSEVEAVGKGSVALGFKCIVPENSPTSNCPATCTDLSPDGAKDLASSMGKNPMDYPRYCLRSCEPTTAAAGTQCRQAAEASQSFEGGARAAGGGSARSGAPAMAPAPEWKKEIDAQQRDKMAGEEEESKALAVKRQVTWDMRRLVMERLRSEAGASVSHGSAAGERVRMNQHVVEHNNVLLKKVKRAIAPLEVSLDEDKTKAKANAESAKEAAKRTKMFVKGAKAALPSVMRKVKDIAIAAIKVKTVAAAAEEAEAYSKRVGWDEPDNYRKILTNRASEPYLKAMATALQRVSEYKAYAKSFADKARATQARAESFAPHATSMEAQGDMMGATTARHEIQQLLQQSKALQGDAEKYWKIAQDAQTSVKQWQDASYAAAAYMTQEYDLGRAPPSE
mmetsp:Transcript_5468/g.13995  ORF Transcript_5468/g.13995 Transcript_5468/m.13995 type:complete len:456 (-) Transcript_5468:107-1474(-)